MLPVAELGDSYPGPRAFDMGLNEACTRLVADISDQEVAVAFPRPPESPENDLAVRHWRRHEVAVSQLDAAFSNGDLRLCLRLPDGSRFLLTSFEWHASAFHYEVSRGGVWRDLAGGLPQHNGLPVFLDEAAYYAWRRAKKAALKIAEAPAAVEAEPPKPAPRSRKKGAPYTSFQTPRARKVLRKRYPDGYPSEEKVSTPDLLKQFANDYSTMLKSGELSPTKRGTPSDSTVLREAGRKRD